MKKTLLFIGIILATLMLVVACATKPAAKPSAQPAAPAVSPATPIVTEPAEPAEPEPAEAEEPAAVEEGEPVPASPARVTTEVTQDDLDRLKADIEGINVEDLGGLTEE